MRNVSFVLALALVAACAKPVTGSSVKAEGDLAALVAKAHVMGLEAAVVKDGRIVWSQGFGFADREAQKAPTVDTVFRLASVSKVLTLTALMRLYDQQKFKLDDDVSGAVGFSVRHPGFPAVAITYRMLLTHTAGINDNEQKLAFAWNEEGDSPLSNDALVEGYFKEGGAYYDKANWREEKPGTSYAYSNYGIALAGYLVARLSGLGFEDAVRTLVLEPLGMTELSWKGAGYAPAGGMAAPYDYKAQAGDFARYAQYGYPEAPAGMARTSAAQLAKLMGLYQGRGAFGGVRLLEEATVGLIYSEGLVLFEREAGQIGHNGGDPGVSTAMFWQKHDPTRPGVIVLANSSPQSKAEAEAMEGVIGDLFGYGL